MGPSGIVKLEVPPESSSGFRDRLVGSQVHLLVLDALPQSFDEHVILPAPLPVHTDLDLTGFQQAGEGITWLFALRRGHTPGKRLVGIRVIKDNGEPSGWGYTFLREFVIKGLLGGFLSGMTGGIYFAAAHLWPLWDRDRQALHDKMIGTLVVQNRR